MSYLDVYKDCRRCPVEKYCGTMVQSTRLCRSYSDNSTQEDTDTTDTIKKKVFNDIMQVLEPIN